MFSGIGGFELGILSAYREKNRRSKENTKSNKRQRLQPSQNEGIGSEVRWVSKQHNCDTNSRATCIGYSEIDKYAIQIYQKHFKGHKNYGDCTRIDWKVVPDFDLLVGGFPCQAFSIAGKRAGFEDTRGTLFFEIARCLKEKQPRLCLLENVKGLLSHDKGATYAIILSTLGELGYDVQWQVLNSKDFGVPQNRERVFIVGHLRGTGRSEVFPITTTDSLACGSGETANTLTVNYWKGPAASRPIVWEKGDKSDSIHTMWRASYTDDMRIRRLTPTECERLQGFPDGWTKGISDTQRYKCLGNAVTVNVIEAIMEKLL